MQARLAIVGSGEGSKAEVLIEASRDGRMPEALPVVLVCDQAHAGMFDVAARQGIDSVDISDVAKDPSARDNKLLQTFKDYSVDFIALAGFNRMIGKEIIEKYKGRIVNTHAAPLPQFGGKGMYGIHLHEKVLASGVTESGPTIHFADEEYDNGAQIAHEPVPVLPNDTPQSLQERVKEVERDLYWRALHGVLQEQGFTAP